MGINPVIAFDYVAYPSVAEILILVALVAAGMVGPRISAWIRNQSVGEAREEDERKRRNW